MYAILKIPILSKEQWKNIQKARSELIIAEIYFDSGYDLRKGILDWKLDWSLEGAELTEKKELVFYQKRVKTTKYIMNAEDELKQAGIYFDSRRDNKDRIVWVLDDVYGAELIRRKSISKSERGNKKVFV